MLLNYWFSGKLKGMNEHTDKVKTSLDSKNLPQRVFETANLGAINTTELNTFRWVIAWYNNIQYNFPIMYIIKNEVPDEWMTNTAHAHTQVQ